MTNDGAREPRSRRTMLGWTTVLILAILGTGAIVAKRARREGRAEELMILQGVRKVCKLATVELSLADYARKTVPKKVDLPFMKEPEAFLFYAGVVSAGFDVCDDAAGIVVDHATKEVRVTLPPPRLLSVDVLRFEIINEQAGLLNSIPPGERNKWYVEARAAIERGALAEGAFERASAHARELFAGFVERRGYTLVYAVDGGTHGAPLGAGR
jgi:hypothetical protein